MCCVCLISNGFLSPYVIATLTVFLQNYFEKDCRGYFSEVLISSHNDVGMYKLKNATYTIVGFYDILDRFAWIVHKLVNCGIC